MGAPKYTADDFAAAALAHMPRGRVWPKDPDSVQARVAQAIGGSFGRSSDAAAALLVDAFPATTSELLPEWEISLGLPDPCAGPSASLQQRRNQVLSRLTNTGGASVAYYEAFAATLGFTITVQRYSPAKIGQNSIGQAMNGVAWAFAYGVVAPATTVTYAQIGKSAMGDPLAAWGNAVLECELTAISPAHAVVLFQYQ